MKEETREGKRGRLIIRAAAAYDREDYDLYESLCELGQRLFGGYPGSFEDDVTDFRLLGPEGA